MCRFTASFIDLLAKRPHLAAETFTYYKALYIGRLSLKARIYMRWQKELRKYGE